MIVRRKRRGFVLLMVLVVLALAGSLLGICARRTSDRALAAGLSARDLQRRWGVRSLQAACLGRAEAILSAPAADGRPAPPAPAAPAAVRRSITLGDAAFDLVIADEQAKANVNRIASLRDAGGLRSSLSALSAGRWVLQVLLRPVEQKTGEIRSPPLQYASLEQVFAAASPADLLGVPPDQEGPAARVTCWGNGKVHFRRAETAVLREMLADVLSEYQVHRLSVLRDEMPEAGLSEILGRLELDATRLAAVQERVTESSSCHSLWIVARGRTRDWYRLCVAQAGDAGNDVGFWTLAW